MIFAYLDYMADNIKEQKCIQAKQDIIYYRKRTPP